MHRTESGEWTVSNFGRVIYRIGYVDLGQTVQSKSVSFWIRTGSLYKPRSKKMKRALQITVCAVASQVAFGGLIWNEDFEGKTVGIGVNDAEFGPEWAGGGQSSYRVRDGGTPFGASNKYLQLQAFGSPWTFVQANIAPHIQPAMDVATFSFDFYAPSAFRKDGYLRTGLGRVTQNAMLVDINNSTDLNIPADLGEDTVIHFDMVANVSGAAATYDIGGTIADGTYDVWVDGTKVKDGLSLIGSGAGGIDSFVLWMNNKGTVDSPVDSMYVDNLEFYDSAHAIPEPATFGFMAIFGGAMLFIRRKF